MLHPQKNSVKMREGTVKKLFSGTAVLTASAMLSKIIGFIYKVPLIGCVGVSGMAYFLAANHIYVLLFVISTSGLPSAVSIMVSKIVAKGDDRAAHQVYRSALWLFVLVGSMGTVCMMIGAPYISQIINIPNSALSIMAIAPGILMACISGALRGYFQGHQIMIHTAVSQIIEAVGKMIFGLIGATYALSKDMDSPSVAAYAVFGITVGVGLSMVYLFSAKLAFDKHIKDKATVHPPKANFIGKLIRLALPITFSAAIISLGGVIDTVLIPNCLDVCGFAAEDINILYSCYGNMAVPMFSLVPALVAPIAMSLMPLVSSSRSSENTETEGATICMSLRLTLLIALPATAGLSAFSGPILQMVFFSTPDAASIAAPMLSVLALSIVPACLITITNSILQAQGKSKNTILSMICGIAVKLIAEYFLVRNRSINIYGAPISTLLCDMTIIGFNIYFVIKASPRFYKLMRPAVGTAISALAAVSVAVIIWKMTDLSNISNIAVVIPIGIAAVLYMAFILLFEAVDKEMAEIILPSIKNKNKKREIANEQRTKNIVSA